MGVHLSIKAKLVLAASAGKELKLALEEFNRACNTLSELAFQRDLHRKYDIHHEGYRLIREETTLPLSTWSMQLPRSAPFTLATRTSFTNSNHILPCDMTPAR